jgi:hypothetical protein
MYPVDHLVKFISLQLGLHSMCKKCITGRVTDIHDAFVGVTRGLNYFDVIAVDHLVNKHTGLNG